jgi:hypothetical protein
MPIYILSLTRRRTVFDQAEIRVQAKSLEAAKEVDIEALEAAGKIDWNCEHHDETDGIYLDDVEEYDDIEVDVDLGSRQVQGHPASRSVSLTPKMGVDIMILVD